MTDNELEMVTKDYHLWLNWEDDVTRKEWLENSKHPRLKRSLIKINEIFKDQLQNKTININLNEINDNNLKSIRFDSDTAARLFFEKFKFIFEWNTTNLHITI